MNAKRIIALSKKDLKSVFRNPATLFLVIIFPLILTLAFGFAFGALGTGMESTYDVAVINNDASGIPHWADDFMDNLDANAVINVKGAETYPDIASAQREAISQLRRGLLRRPLASSQ